MELKPRERWKLGALGVAIVVGSVFIVIEVASGGSDTAARVQNSSVDGSLASPPKEVWTLDIARLGVNSGDVLMAMPTTLSSYYGYGSVLDAGDTLIAATAYPLPTPEPSSGTDVGAVTLVGLDPADGRTRWKTGIGEVEGCTQEVRSDFIACWGDRRIAFVNIAEGTLLSDIGTDFDIGFVDTFDDDVYVSGDLNGSPVLTKGTVTDIASGARRSYEPGVDFSYVQAVVAAVVSYRGDGDPQYIYKVYDIDSGDERFTYEGDSVQGVGHGLFLSSIGSSSGTVGTQNLLGSDGSIIRAIPIPAYPAVDIPTNTEDEVPLFLGDGAYDPDTGDELWRNPLMVQGQFSGPSTAVVAVVGSTVVVADPDAKTITGLDLSSGKQKWQTPWEDAYWIRNGLTDGSNYIFGDYQGMHAIDVRTGRILWSLPQPDATDPRSVIVASAGGQMTRSSVYGFSVWR